MKVCLLTPEFLPEWGGVGTYAYNLARGLRDRAEVHVLSGALPKGSGVPLDGVRVHAAFPRQNSRRNVSPFRFQMAVFRRLPRLLRTHKFDIIHANHAYMSDLLARLRPNASAGIITVHTTIDTQVGGTLLAGPGSPRQRFEANLARWRLPLQAIERHYLRRTSAMIFVSRWVRDRTVQTYRVHPRLSEIVPNAVDTERLSPSGPPSPADSSGVPTLLFAGRLLALKGLDTLLRAVAQVTVPVRLLIAGPGDQAPWRALADDLGLPRDRYEFLGRVPYGEMPDLYRRVDAVVLPSFSESCPLVALEAMACGTPLIASNAGGVAEIVGDGETGWLFTPGDVSALVSQIETVIADGARVKAVSARARAWVESNASIDRMAERTFAFYERFLQGAAS